MTTQYGSGTTFQQQCPPFPAPPTGYQVWDEDLDGAVPAAIVQHAQQLAGNMNLPLGYADTVWNNGVALIVRVDPHPWTTDAQGNVVAGCYHGATVYTPAGIPQSSSAAVQAPSSSSTTTLFALSLVLGTVVSAISIAEWLRRG